MAQVDFSNAVLSISVENPLLGWWTGFSSSQTGGINNSYSISNASGTAIANNLSFASSVVSKTKLVFTIAGTFTASGTEFHIWGNSGTTASTKKHCWKVSNVSFASGDTFTFQTSVTLSTS